MDPQELKRMAEALCCEAERQAKEQEAKAECMRPLEELRQFIAHSYESFRKLPAVAPHEAVQLTALLLQHGSLHDRPAFESEPGERIKRALEDYMRMHQRSAG